jgi:Domain of unknown function (DUF6379)
MPLNIIEDNSLRATQDGYQLEARLNWYRSLPLSCVERIELSLDGQPVPPDAIRFGINGHEYRLEELAAHADEFWFVLDSALLGVRDPGRVKAGESHKLELQLAVRAPYILVGPGKFLTPAWQYATTQVAA